MAEQKNTQNSMDVVEVINASEAFIIKHKNLITTVVLALIIIVGGIILYQHYVVEPRETKASTMLAKGQELYNEDLFETALYGDSIGYKGFIKIAEEDNGTDAGNLANAYAGICLARLEKYDEAIPYLEKFNGNDQLVAPAVKGTLGNCYAYQNNLEKAANLLMEAAKEADSHAISPIYLIQAGEIYEKLGKNTEAVNAYQTIKDKYFNSYAAMTIDKYIERASK